MFHMALALVLSAAEWKPSSSVEGINEYALPNGMRVLTFPDASKPTVTVNVTYFVGSRHEDYGETGMAHLLEHLLFKGTPTTKDVPKALADRGARSNGTTWLDRTNYYETLPATDENTEWALRFEADRMVNSFIAKKDLDSEMTVVRNELEAGENQPTRVLMQRVLSTAFIWHNYGQSTIGARSDVEHVPIERLQAFYRKHYQPDNALLVVAGKFDEQKVLGWIKDSFGKLPKPTRKLIPTYTEEPTQDGERTVTLRRVGDVQAIMAVYHVPPGSHADAAAVEVLSNVLGATPAGRLHKTLVEAKKASSVFAWAMQEREPGVVLFGAEVRKEQALDAARDVLVKTIEDFGRAAPSEKEVERAKAEIQKDFDLVMNDSLRMALELSEWAAMGDWRLYFIQRDRIAEVKPADVQRVARTYLKTSNRTLGTFLPTEKPDRAEIPAAPDINAMVKDYKGRTGVAAGEAFDPSPKAIEQRTKRARLPGGTRTALLYKKTRAGVVHMALALHTGSEKSLMGKDVAGSMACEMLMRGTQKHTREELQAALDKLKAQLRVMGDATRCLLSLEVQNAQLGPALELVREVVREPRFDTKEFELLRQEELADNEEAKSQPQAMGRTAYEKHVRPWPKGHPYYALSAEETIAELKAVKLADVKAFYRDFYGADASDLAFVGDFDEATVMAFAKAAFDGFQAKQKFERIPQPHVAVPAKTISLATPDKANAFFMAGLPVEVADTDPDYAALTLGNFLLGGAPLSSRLARIRTRDGLSYGVGSFFRPNPLDKSAVFTAYAIYAPENRAALEKVFDAELKKALQEGFADDELKAAKTGWQQMRQVQRSQDPSLAMQLCDQSFYGRTFDFDADLEAKVSSLDKKTMQAALSKHIRLDGISKVFAGDFSKAEKH